MRLYRNLFMGAVLALVLPLQSANAVTECYVTLYRIFSGDGIIWLNYTNGGSGVVQANDPDKEATLSLAMTALVSGREVIVRYEADGVPCNSGSNTLIGFWFS